MTRRDTLKCIHEPFGDAFYYGGERLSTRFENDEQTRVDSGFQKSTYQTTLDRLEAEGAEVRLSFCIRTAFQTFDLSFLPPLQSFSLSSLIDGISIVF